MEMTRVGTRLQLEARVLAIFDAVKSGMRVEDGSVELKSDWPDPEWAARRLAAHANSARGEDILWILGLDESLGVRWLSPVDLADWWPQVRSYFDDVAPTLSDLVVHTEDGALQALVFDTSLSPFVVKNSAYGRTGGGSVEREVPWRDGTAVRSARRADLIRMLAPVARLPEIEVLTASASGRSRSPEEQRGQSYNEITAAEYLSWYFDVEMYVTPAIGGLAVLPVHRTKFEFAVDDGPYNLVSDAQARYYAPSSTSFSMGGFQSTSDSASVEATTSEAIVHLPGRVGFHAQHIEAVHTLSPKAAIRVRFAVIPIHTDRSLLLEVELSSTSADRDGTLTWAFPS
jgi:hypothetical protein